MNLRNKIEEIRQQPEHIRIRYVWLSVTVVMIFIIAVWIFSLKVEFSKEQSKLPVPTLPALPALPEQGNAGTSVAPNAEGFNPSLGNTDSAVTPERSTDNSQE